MTTDATVKIDAKQVKELREKSGRRCRFNKVRAPVGSSGARQPRLQLHGDVIGESPRHIAGLS